MTEKRLTVSGEDNIACKLRKIESNGRIQLNNKCINESTAKTVLENWKSKQNFQCDESGISLSHSPYSHCVLTNIIESKDAIETLLHELQDLEFAEKNNDLYQFHQSEEDLKTAQSEQIKDFRELMCKPIRDWLVKATGIPLNDTVDMFCSHYGHTDILLCHDDELEGRRIAYIYYLVKSWASEDGGTLDLFSVDENVQPKDIVKSIVPVRNRLVFFEVSPGSYHQVSEVLSQDKIRWSVAGWFHGPPIQRPSPYLESPRPLHPYGAIDDDVFFDWVNPVYMGIGAQGSIQEKFETDSEIELQDFLLPEKYEELLAALKSEVVMWERRGPANKRCYDQITSETLPPAIKTCLDLFKSDAMFLMLSNFTGLKLHELAGVSSCSENEDSDSDNEAGSDSEAPGTASQSCSTSSAGTELKSGDTNKGANGTDACSADAGKITSDEGGGHLEKGTENKDKSATVKVEKCHSGCRSEIRRWTERCYTLVHDTDTEGSEFALDAVFFVGCNDWKSEYGGFTSYIAKGEDEELLTVTPSANSLALVYRDKDTLKFNKYLNSQVRHMQNNGFYDVNTVYYENIQ